jgi:hypothetical protein
MSPDFLSYGQVHFRDGRRGFLPRQGHHGGVHRAASSLTRGLNVRMLKMDPYLNVDPGTMSPYQHGEVYVTDDGAETDLDLGHYERFTGQPTSRTSNFTAGRIYWEVLQQGAQGRLPRAHHPDDPAHHG